MSHCDIDREDACEQFEGCYDRVPTYDEWLESHRRGLEAAGCGDEDREMAEALAGIF